MFEANVWEKWGGRRFWLCVGSAFFTTVLTYLGKVDGTVYATVILGTVGAYITGNTLQKVKARDAETANP